MPADFICILVIKKKKKALSPKQKKIAGMAGNKMKIDGADFKALRRRGGMR